MSALRRTIAQALVTAAATCASAAAAAPPHDDSTKAACASASEDAQLMRIKGQLVEARSRLLECARDVCPSLVKHDCETWLGEVETSLPTIVLSAKNAAGHDLDDVRVTLDDHPWLDRLDGQAVPIDAGTHVLRFEHGTDAPVEQRLVVVEGQKDRLVAVTFAAPVTPVTPPAPPQASSPSSSPPPPAPPEERPWRVPVLTWILGGVGLAAVGIGAYVGIDGLDRYHTDQSGSGCAQKLGGCPTSEKNAISNEWLAAGIALGVGGAALAAGAIVLFTSQDRKASAAAWQLEVAPSPRGVRMGVAGRF